MGRPIGPRKYFSYALIRAVDGVRDESLNVGVLVLDSDSQAITTRVTKDLSRIGAALPNVAVDRLEIYLSGLPEFFSQELGRTTGWLEGLAKKWGNGVRLSGARSIAGENIERVADDLFRQYVELP